MISFTGINRAGTCVSGWTHKPAPVFVEAKYRARWQELTVTAADGEVVGEIHDLTDDGRRIWWAMDAEEPTQ